MTWLRPSIYLATRLNAGPGQREIDLTETTNFVHCSDQCRTDGTHAQRRRTGLRNGITNADDRYAFDERCSSRGVLVPTRTLPRNAEFDPLID